MSELGYIALILSLITNIYMGWERSRKIKKYEHELWRWMQLYGQLQDEHIDTLKQNNKMMRQILGEEKT